jgi:flagellar motor switch protein FliM
VQRTGLSALADTYGLERSELQQVRLLGQRFFDSFAEILARYVGSRIEVTQIRQRSEKFSDFDAAGPDHYQSFLGFDGEPALAMRLEHSLATAIVDALLGGSCALGREGADSMIGLTSTEVRMLSKVLDTVLIGAFQPLNGALFRNPAEAEILKRIDQAGGAKRFEVTEAMVVIEALCALGEQRGWLGIALPTSIISQVRRRLSPERSAPPVRPATASIGRTALAEAALPIRALLATQQMSLAEVRKLGPGSVIALGKLQRNLPRVALIVEGQTLVHGTVVEEKGWRRFLIENA